MSVFLLHQKKQPFHELKRYSVVLTTYGLVASEFKQYNKHVEQRRGSPAYNEAEDMELAKKCPLLHPTSKFYRVILDEARKYSQDCSHLVQLSPDQVVEKYVSRDIVSASEICPRPP